MTERLLAEDLRIVAGVLPPTGAVGATLVELALRQQIELVDGKLQVTGHEAPLPPLLDAVRATLARKGPTEPKWLLPELAREHDVGAAVEASLCEQGALLERRRFLRIAVGAHPVDPAARQQVVDRLSALADGADDERARALGGLVGAIHRWHAVLPVRKQRRAVQAAVSAPVGVTGAVASAVDKSIRASSDAVSAAVYVAVSDSCDSSDGGDGGGGDGGGGD